MTTLEQQIHALREQYHLNQTAGQSRVAIDDCRGIHERFSKFAERLKELQRQTTALAVLPADAPESMDLTEAFLDQRSKVEASVKSFVQVWRKNKNLARQDDALDNAQKALQHLTEQLSEKVDSCWKAWTEQLFNSCVVEKAILENQRDIPGLEKIYSEYVELQKKFITLARTVPSTVWPLEELMDLVVRMREVRDRMTLNLPENVKRFFMLLNQRRTSGCVSLSALDKDTFGWLLDNNMLDQFVVERSRKLF